MRKGVLAFGETHQGRNEFPAFVVGHGKESEKCGPGLAGLHGTIIRIGDRGVIGNGTDREFAEPMLEPEGGDINTVAVLGSQAQGFLRRFNDGKVHRGGEVYPPSSKALRRTRSLELRRRPPPSLGKLPPSLGATARQDGGGRRCPEAPTDVSLFKNATEAAAHNIKNTQNRAESLGRYFGVATLYATAEVYEDFKWFRSQVKTDAPWDFQHGNYPNASQYQDY